MAPGIPRAVQIRTGQFRAPSVVANHSQLQETYLLLIHTGHLFHRPLDWGAADQGLSYSSRQNSDDVPLVCLLEDLLLIRSRYRRGKIWLTFVMPIDVHKRRIFSGYLDSRGKEAMIAIDIHSCDVWHIGGIAANGRQLCSGFWRWCYDVGD